MDIFGILNLLGGLALFYTACPPWATGWCSCPAAAWKKYWKS